LIPKVSPTDACRNAWCRLRHFKVGSKHCTMGREGAVAFGFRASKPGDYLISPIELTGRVRRGTQDPRLPFDVKFSHGYLFCVGMR
jgi:hypothetical protein